MNNASTSPAHPEPHRAQGPRDRDGDNGVDRISSPATPAPNSRTQDAGLSNEAKDGLTRKLQFLTNLTTSLDTLVFAELCALYYMEYGP